MELGRNACMEKVVNSHSFGSPSRFLFPGHIPYERTILTRSVVDASTSIFWPLCPDSGRTPTDGDRKVDVLPNFVFLSPFPSPISNLLSTLVLHGYQGRP